MKDVSPPLKNGGKGVLYIRKGTDVMSMNRKILELGNELLSNGLPSVVFITGDQTDGIDGSIHRHDTFELRFVFRSPAGGLSRLDIVFPQICHRLLSEDENLRTLVFFLDPPVQYCQQPGSLPDFIRSRYAVTLVDFLSRLEENDFSEEKKLELRLLTALFCLTARQAEQDGPPFNRIHAFARFLRTFYFRSEISIAGAARQFGFSPRSVQGVFRKTFGMNPKDYLLRCRMENAASLLLGKRYLINEIASLCGYADEHYFSNAFHRFYGCSPRSYVKSRNS